MVTPPAAANPRTATRRTRRAGFALMDAVIAGILLAIGMVAVLSVAGQALGLARAMLGDDELRHGTHVQALAGVAGARAERDRERACDDHRQRLDSGGLSTDSRQW